MPNWEHAELYFPNITDDEFDTLVEKFCTTNEQTGETVIDFEKIEPMPDNVYRGKLGCEELRKYPGELNWYDWRCKHWGTKWNVVDGSTDYSANCLIFDTAWDYPTKVIEKLVELTGHQIESWSINEDITCGICHHKCRKVDGKAYSEIECIRYNTDEFWKIAKEIFDIEKELIDDE